jgi:hypothetical protein
VSGAMVWWAVPPPTFFQKSPLLPHGRSDGKH